MTDEKKKPEEDEVSDEQLEHVAGGIVIINGKPVKYWGELDKKLMEPLNKSMDREGTIE